MPVLTWVTRLVGFWGLLVLVTPGRAQETSAQIRIDQRWEQQIVEPVMNVLPIGTHPKCTDQNVVQGRCDALFQPYSTSFFNGQRTANWLTIQVTNQTQTPKVLYLGTSRFEYMQCWVKTGTTITGPQVSGQKLSESAKTIPVVGFSFFSFTCLPNQPTTVYIKATNLDAASSPQLITPFTLTDKTHFKNDFEKPANYTFIFIGVALCMLIYNCVLFFTTQLRTYLFYVGYVISITILELGLVPQLAYPVIGHSDINRSPLVYFANLGVVFYILVAQDVMEIRNYYPRINKILLITTGALLVSAILIPIPGSTFLRTLINFPSALVAYTLLLLVGFLMTGRRHLPSILFFLASSIYLIGALVFMLQLLQILPSGLFGIDTSTLFQITISWEMTLASLSLGARINEMRRQLTQEQIAKERLQQEREQERRQLIETQNVLLEKQVRERTDELEKSLETLKATQTQLIQREKMAFLGELTAGIAHEIQNPLNFVNNFAELSVELVEELRTDLQNSQADSIATVANYLESNLSKIVQHGRRAESIVKGMLMHSRTNTGSTQPVRLNAVVDEFLRLAYQGFRSKEKEFNTKLTTRYDDSMGTVICDPQQLSQVLLNLYTNAFYAVYQKQKASPEAYQPEVIVTTQQTALGITIVVHDNGPGIAPPILNKIFQPFFTTKPTGQGTGLGLSLSYDITTKGLSGELTVRSIIDLFTEFTIRLPIKTVADVADQ